MSAEEATDLVAERWPHLDPWNAGFTAALERPLSGARRTQPAVSRVDAYEALPVPVPAHGRALGGAAGMGVLRPVHLHHGDDAAGRARHPGGVVQRRQARGIPQGGGARRDAEPTVRPGEDLRLLEDPVGGL